MPPANRPSIYTTAQLAAELDCTEPHARRLIREGVLAAERVEGWRVSPEALAAALRRPDRRAGNPGRPRLADR